jgi:hypothetical protein
MTSSFFFCPSLTIVMLKIFLITVYFAYNVYFRVNSEVRNQIRCYIRTVLYFVELC